MNTVFKKVTVITGHYGCGKTNLAVNTALELCKKGSVCVIDLDTVNPYFRSADFKELFSQKGINLICPNYANTNLDIPSFNFNLGGLINDHDYTIIDMGGDDSGAFPLGKFKETLNEHKTETDVLYVFNMYRDIKDNVKETVRLMRDIEKAAGIKCSGLVNNSNLGEQNVDKTVTDSLKFAESVSDITGLEIKFTCVPKDFSGEVNTKIFKIERLVKAPWER